MQAAGSPKRAIERRQIDRPEQSGRSKVVNFFRRFSARASLRTNLKCVFYAHCRSLNSKRFDVLLLSRNFDCKSFAAKNFPPLAAARYRKTAVPHTINNWFAHTAREPRELFIILWPNGVYFCVSCRTHFVWRQNARVQSRIRSFRIFVCRSFDEVRVLISVIRWVVDRLLFVVARSSYILLTFVSFDFRWPIHHTGSLLRNDLFLKL